MRMEIRKCTGGKLWKEKSLGQYRLSLKIEKYNDKLSQHYFRLIIHSQSLTIKGSTNHPKNVHPKDNFNTIRKPRLPTPPSSQKRRQFQHYTKSSLGTRSNSVDWHVSLSQCESDDSGRGDSEWSDISESSTKKLLETQPFRR